METNTICLISLFNNIISALYKEIKNDKKILHSAQIVNNQKYL